MRGLQGARQQDPLVLAAGQRTSHVADQAVVGHGHRHDLVVDARHGGALGHALLIELGIEEADIVGDRARQQRVILHDRGNLLPVGADADGVKRASVDQDFAAGGVKQAEHDLPAGWSCRRRTGP